MLRSLPFLPAAALLANAEPGFAEEKSSDPPAPTLSVGLEELSFVARRKQNYTLIFKARPDAERFQVQRKATAAWPNAAIFFLKAGDSSTDDQIRVESLEEKEAVNELGIRIDASELTVTYLPTGAEFILVRGVETTMPTYYAEFAQDGKKSFVKQGDSFRLAGNPDLEFRLLSVKEGFVEIGFEPEGGKPRKIKIDRKP